jgi:hypothetical protein
MTDPWPDVYLTGPGRSGTTSLYQYLTQHPEIYAGSTKEHRYFDETVPAVEDDPEALAEAREAYLDRFRGAEGHELVVDGTPSYVYYRDALERIHEKRPDARFITSYRDPVERTYSLYWLMVASGKEEMDFLDAIEEGLADDRAGRYHTDRVKFIRNSRQGTQLQRLHEIFGEDQVLVLLFTDVVEDTSQVLVDVAEFLDIDPEIAAELDTETQHNATPGVPPNELAHMLRSSDTLKTIAQTLLPESVRDFLGNQVLLEEREKPPMDPEARRKLAEVFEPEVRQVEKLLDRELPELRASWPEDVGRRAEP